MNPIDINPETSIVMPSPRNGTGMFEYASFLRIAAIAIMAKAQPIPPPTPKTRDSIKL